jgi:hypothetical protein
MTPRVTEEIWEKWELMGFGNRCDAEMLEGVMMSWKEAISMTTEIVASGVGHLWVRDGAPAGLNTSSPHSHNDVRQGRHDPEFKKSLCPESCFAKDNCFLASEDLVLWVIVTCVTIRLFLFSYPCWHVNYSTFMMTCKCKPYVCLKSNLLEMFLYLRTTFDLYFGSCFIRQSTQAHSSIWIFNTHPAYCCLTLISSQ